MGSNQKRRFIIVGGIIVIVMIVALAIVSAGTGRAVMTVAQATDQQARGQRVEVTGNVVDNSFSISHNAQSGADELVFDIYDTDDPESTLHVFYDKGVAATFGNGVTAICKGEIDDSGTLRCSELVTKCPSKYETATDALDVERLLGYGAEIIDKPVKVKGRINMGTLDAPTASVRFTFVDARNEKITMPVKFAGAIPDTIQESVQNGEEGAPKLTGVVVLTGSLGSDGSFAATVLAEEA